KTLDANKYATKKTIAQGLLDVALLTANASQLKYVLQVGEKHEFYALMLSLISISIVLQLVVAILFVIIGGLNINKHRDHSAAIILNDVTAALLSIVVSILLTYEDEKFANLSWILNYISLGFVTGALFCDVIKMNFGLDPAVAVNVVQAILCVLLGTTLNLNKEDHQQSANRANNVILCINIILMAVNILISSFEMKESTATT
ncbi:ninjurin-1, partial [Asbolus verrucosus]